MCYRAVLGRCAMPSLCCPRLRSSHMGSFVSQVVPGRGPLALFDGHLRVIPGGNGGMPRPGSPLGPKSSRRAAMCFSSQRTPALSQMV
jgi:hypothetical protein